MLREIVSEATTNRDVISEIAKVVDTVDKMKADGPDLIVNGSSKGKKINFTLSGKVSDYSDFVKYYKRYKKNIDQMIKEIHPVVNKGK